MAKVALYGTARPIVRQSFVGVKKLTVPNQSLSLREIVKRFIRREPLPLSHDGLYETRFGDLEKLSKADIFDQFEKVAELKEQIAAFNKRVKDKEVADAAAKAAAVVVGSAGGVASPPPVGEPLVKSPPPKGA